MINALLEKLKTYLFASVPADVAACEFDCRKLECQAEEWQTCARRLQKVEALKQLAEYE